MGEHPRTVTRARLPRAGRSSRAEGAPDRPLTVLVNAGPWLAVPPPHYGGIENVVATLVGSLREAGHRVVLATVGESTQEADGRVCAYETGQLDRLAGSYGDVVGIAHAHMAAVVGALQQDPSIDLVHDHLEVVGPSLLAALGPDVPPVLQTLHWDLAKHPRFYETFDGGGRVWFAGVSANQLADAPPALRRQVLGVVPLAAPPPRGPVLPPGDHVLTLGRLTPLKGFHLAAQACLAVGVPLVMAGPVGGFPDRRALDAALAEPDQRVAAYPDVRYFRREVEPLLDGERVRWVGAVGGAAKAELVGTARALLFPLQWEEPGGTAIVEALLAGVPVVGFRRGCLPSLVEHGVTGFVVDTVDEMAAALRRVDDLDREAIARRVRRRFSPARMAADYLALYREVLARSDRRSTGPTADAMASA